VISEQRATLGQIARAGLLNRALALWFVLWTGIRVQAVGWTGAGWDLSFIGRDFWIYRNAGRAVLDGGNPWDASFLWNGTAWHFAAPPTAAQLFAPFALLNDALGLGIFVALSIWVAWAALRQLGLPTWWLLFPPMSEGILAANPQVLLFGLVVLGSGSWLRASASRALGQDPVRSPSSGAGGLRQLTVGLQHVAVPLARAIAVGLKVYALAPIVARREGRALLAVGLVLVASVLLGPGLWVRYVTDLGSISARVLVESEGGLSAALFLQPRVFSTLLPTETMAVVGGLVLYGLIVVLVLLAALKDVVAAGWIVAPLLFPAAEYHLATMALPVARRLAIWVLAVPTIPTYLLGMVILCYQVTAGHRPIAASDAPVSLATWSGGLPRPGLPRISESS
jgi:hypothetical protein